MHRTAEEILHDVIEIAKAMGLWQVLTLREKKVVVGYFRDQCEHLHRDPAPHRLLALKSFTVII